MLHGTTDHQCWRHFFDFVHFHGIRDSGCLDDLEDGDAKEWVAAVQEFDIAEAAVEAKPHRRECELCHTSSCSYADDNASLLAGQWMPQLRQRFADCASGDRGMLDQAMKHKIDPLNAVSIDALIHCSNRTVVRAVCSDC